MGVCKHCQKPTFKGADGKPQHERRAKADEYGGRRKQPNPSSTPGQTGAGGGKNVGTGDGHEQEREPDRSHPLHRMLFGKKE